MKVKDLMVTPVISIHCDKKVEEAAKLMIEHNISVLPVVGQDNALVGIITESDFVGKEVDIPHALASIKQLFGQSFYFKDIESIYAQAKQKEIGQVMTKHVQTCFPEASMDDLVSMMMKHQLKRVPVVKEKGSKTLVGIVTRRDLVKAFVRV